MKLSEKSNTKQFSESKFKNGKQTCPLCGRTDEWDCRITEDEGFALCKFTPNESGEKDVTGIRYKHVLKKGGNRNPQSKATTNDDSKETAKADADRLNAVYSALLEGLELKKRHSDDLLYRRRLNDTEIARNLYATVPPFKDRYEIAQKLAKQFDLQGIPGFSYSSKLWLLNMTFPGFYVPYRDEQGRIIGLQIRTDEENRDKYMWLSSKGKSKGASSGTPPHFVNVDSAGEKKEVFLTEGALKADIIGSILGVTVVATAGVSVVNPEEIATKLMDTFPDLERLVVAYDMDWQTNEDVRFGLFRLLNALIELDVKVEVATWDSSLGKGLDDVVVNEAFTENSVKYIPVNEFLAMISSIVIEETEAIEDFEPVDEFMNDELIGDEKFIEAQQLDLKQVDLDSEQESERETECEDNPIVYSYGEFSELDIKDLEKVIFGLGRGNVGLMVASTNIGKTTLALNLALSATGRREFNPLLNDSHKARRVLYIDGEATKAELQADIAKMLEVFSSEQVRSVRDNLFLICDEELNDEPLDLVKESHFDFVKRNALACKPDLIVVDTLSALMDLADENDNAKVKKEAMKPLKNLAKQTNSAVLLLHHTGKYNEGASNANKAYNGRGASAFGALSRTVITLEKEKTNPDKVVLSVPKVKGDKFNETILELDQKSRWFNVVEEVAKAKAVSNYEQVIEFVINAQTLIKRNEINLAFNGEDEKPHIAVSTITKHLNDAVANGRLASPRYGYYSTPKNIEAELPVGE